jgi:hypothetical protein
VCVCVALGIQLAMRMSRIVARPAVPVFFHHIVIYGTFLLKTKIIESKLYVLIFSTNFLLKKISFQEEFSEV